MRAHTMYRRPSAAHRLPWRRLAPSLSPLFSFTALWIACLVVPLPPSLQAMELTGYVEAEGRLFPRQPAAAGQAYHDASLAIQPEVYGWLANGWRASLVIFGRSGGPDNERNHWDLREASLSKAWGALELELGVGRVFWGATEFVHLVDIVNQTDLVEDIDGDDKLGQPLIRLTYGRSWGAVDLFLLPFFRPRTFPGPSGRLRPTFPILQDEPDYESARGRDHVDYAGRLTLILGPTDIGIAFFAGTNREPLLLPKLTGQGMALVPYYQQIRQISIDAQAAVGDWLWKFEGRYRDAAAASGSAAVGGVEYTLYAVGDTAADIGLLAEYGWDQRRGAQAIAQDNDLMLGLRLAANDTANTTLLLGLGLNLAGDTSFLRLEGEQRLGERWKLIVEGSLFFTHSDATDALASLADDDFFRLQLRRYF